jgi:hypothetical protein
MGDIKLPWMAELRCSGFSKSDRGDRRSECKVRTVLQIFRAVLVQQRSIRRLDAAGAAWSITSIPCKRPARGRWDHLTVKTQISDGKAVFLSLTLNGVTLYDGFRALAVVEYGRCTLFSRNGHPFASFADLATRIGNALMPRSLIMDGEIVCLDEKGHCRFNDLLFRRYEPCFVAFDLLHDGDKDLRHEQLIDRKHQLRSIVGAGLSPIVYADHIQSAGIALFEKACELDLEGIVAKYQHGPYDPEQTSWFKIRNRSYSQMVGRETLFERERHREPVPGWHTCALAASQGSL